MDLQRSSMIHFFPMPYPDESIYSIFSRYNILTGNNNYQITVNELVGSSFKRITPYYSNNLQFLCDQLPENTVYTTQYFIENHTILPFFKSFVPDERFERAINSNEANILQRIGYTPLFDTDSIFYCPHCIKEDKKIYGEAYIHRSHQIDGNFICWKHKTFLSLHPIPKSKDCSFFDIEQFGMSDINFATEYQKEFLHLSSGIEKIFINYTNLPKYSLVRSKYFSQLNNKGYIINNGVINEKKLHNDFIDFYSENFLDSMNLFPEIGKISWLKKIMLTIPTLRSYHPIKHLLLINFLFGDITSFFNYQDDYILDYQKYYHSDRRYVIKDKSSDKYFRKKEFHQNKIIHILKQKPNLLRKQIYKENPYTYQWLIQNEKDWLETVLPKPYNRHCDIIDWGKRDAEFYIKTLEVIKYLLENNILEKISAFSLGKYVKYNFSADNLKKLPNTKALIEKYSESYPDFYKRKFNAYIHEIIQ